ncbi:MAG TPA: hypothetical protein VGK56_11320 [Anaerolineales bacterium]
MNHRLKVGLVGLVLITTLLACNMPEQFPPPNDMQTAAALTLQAILTPSRTFVASTSTQAVTGTPSARVTQTTAVTGSPETATSQTPTYSVPMLTVQEATNCRTGPGEEYDIVLTYQTGRELEIVGRYDPENFWLVKASESPTGTCWLWGEFVEVTGSHWAVSSVTPPPTATSAPPRGPGIIEWNFSCSGGAITFTVNWADNASGEEGYRIFRNGEAIAELPPDTTTYTDVYDLPADQNVEYYIQVHAPTGSANSSIMRMRCGG